MTHSDMAIVSACADATSFSLGGSETGGAGQAQGVHRPRCEVSDEDLLNEWRIRCTASDGRDEADARARLCMAVIDADRLRALREEHGYDVSACVMPKDCTPKNHILVGVKT